MRILLGFSLLLFSPRLGAEENVPILSLADVKPPPFEDDLRVTDLKEPPGDAPRGKQINGLSSGIWSEKAKYYLNAHINIWITLANHNRDENGHYVPYDEDVVHKDDYLHITFPDGTRRRIRQYPPEDGMVGVGFTGGISELLHRAVRSPGKYRLQWVMGDLKSNVVEFVVMKRE